MTGDAGPTSPQPYLAGTDGPPAHPFADLLGLEVETTGEGTATARLELADRHRNPHGMAHGAVLFALVDTSMGGAAMSVVPPGRWCASIDVQLRFVRPVAAGGLVAETEVVHPGRTVVQLTSTVRSTETGKVVATATGAFAVLGGDIPAGPSPGDEPGTAPDAGG